MSWLLCFIFTVTDVFPPEPDKYGFYARTDARQGILAAAPWFKIPYPCKCVYISEPQKDKSFVLLSNKELPIRKMKEKRQLKWDCLSVSRNSFVFIGSFTVLYKNKWTQIVL